MRLKLKVLSLLAFLTAFPVNATDLPIASGSYDYGMLVGFDPATKIVTGYFSDETGGGNFTCIFYLTGKLNGSEAAIATYFPQTPTEDLIEGKMVFQTRSEFRVRLPSEHGGCWNVAHFADDTQPAQFSLSAAHPWLSIAVVKSEKAFFFDTPAGAIHRKGYLVKGDPIGVRATKSGWLQVDFVGTDKLITGWIKQSDTYPAR